LTFSDIIYSFIDSKEKVAPMKSGGKFTRFFHTFVILENIFQDDLKSKICRTFAPFFIK